MQYVVYELCVFVCLSEDMAEVFNRCTQCWPFKDNVLNSMACENLQRLKGCHACGTVGCWTTNSVCAFYNRHREHHQDADVGDNVPHMSQTCIEILKDGPWCKSLQNSTYSAG